MNKSMQNRIRVLTLVVASCIVPLSQAAVIDDMLNSYEAQGGKNFSAAAGEKMWLTDHPDPDDASKVRNCSTCHTKDLTAVGKHVKTGKKIDRLAPSANSERFTEAKKIKKWFKRNCKWVLGRECTPQEKGDFLTYLRNK